MSNYSKSEAAHEEILNLMILSCKLKKETDPSSKAFYYFNDLEIRNKTLNQHKLTYKEYNRLLKEQDYKCSVCKSYGTGNLNSNFLFVDHCHKSGKVRGLLCDQCNKGLGNFKDNPEFLLQAIKYLTKG